MGWKIVRDNDAQLRLVGVSGQWRPSADPIGGLTKKLFEEASEFAETHDPGELYDLLDVVKELTDRLDPYSEYRAAHGHKVAERGYFTKAIEWTPIPARAD